MTLQTEFEFSLPKGYIDAEGNLHKKGVMRLATAADEILPLKDYRIKQNPAYLTVILLSRVLTKLGNLRDVNPKTIEGLFSSDVSFLQDFYRRINENGTSEIDATCPKCEHKFKVEVNSLGEE